MGKDRLQGHNGRTHKDKLGSPTQVYNPRHNSRSFEDPNYDDGHINHDLTQYNIYYDMMKEKFYDDQTRKDEFRDFAEIEKDMYDVYYADYLDKTNEQYRRNRHVDRIKSIDMLLADPKFCPEETIWQIGNRDQIQFDRDPKTASALLKTMAEKFLDWHNETYQHIKIMDMAIHVDETTPHIHMRKMYFEDIETEDGSIISRPRQEKALIQDGIELPDPSKKPSRLNNRKVVYTKACRDKMFEICHELGLEIEERPLEKSKKDQELDQWQIEQDTKKLAELQQQIESQQQQLDQLLMQVSRWAEVVKQFSDKQTHDFFYQEIPKLFGAPEEKLRSGLEEFPSGRKEGKVELWQYQWEKFTDNYDKLSQMAADMTKSVEDLKSMPRREAALKAEQTKLDKLREETKQLKTTYKDLVKHQDEYIGGKAEELINDIIHKQQILDPKDSRSKRLEDFCRAYTDRSGKSMLDIFNEQENARIERQKSRALDKVDSWMEKGIGDD